MKEILANLALINTLNFCKENKLDCTGSHLIKYPRRFTYALVEATTNRAIVTVTFYKNKVPFYFVRPND